jgi:hypothetical protein
MPGQVTRLARHEPSFREPGVVSQFQMRLQEASDLSAEASTPYGSGNPHKIPHRPQKAPNQQEGQHVGKQVVHGDTHRQSAKEAGKKEKQHSEEPFH